MSAEALEMLPIASAGGEPQLELAPGDIHLWLTYYDDAANERLHSHYRSLLSMAERAQEFRFYFAHDRRRYLVTRALVRTALSRYSPIRPKDWVFSTNEYGRPRIANVLDGDAQLSFNISHTNSLIVLGVTRSGALGVDVENFMSRAVSIDIADRYFSPGEVTALAAAPPAQQQYRFFEYWTFKEAYIKARGMGLSLPLDKFGFHYPEANTVSLTIAPELQDDASRWRLWLFRPRAEYLVAVCAERGYAPARICVRQGAPMLGQHELVPRFLRTSE